MTARSPWVRRVAASGAAAALAVTVMADPAAAHHGWDAYETTTAYDVIGTLTDVEWANPHVHVELRLDEGAAVPPDWGDRELPEGNTSDAHQLRADTVWVDGAAVRQRLLSLPDMPQPAPPTSPASTNASQPTDDTTASRSPTGPGRA